MRGPGLRRKIVPDAQNQLHGLVVGIAFDLRCYLPRGAPVYKASVPHVHCDLLCAPVESLLHAEVQLTLRPPQVPAVEVCQ